MIYGQAMVIACVACLVPPLPRLNRHKPADRLCTFPGLALIAVSALGLLALGIGHMALLVTRPWFAGGNGTGHMVSQTALHDSMKESDMLESSLSSV